MIDLLSDTVTKPTPRMIDAMTRAEVGDDVYGEDPTTNQLEHRCAALFGKEAGCFVASGTMANLLTILAWCPRGREVIVGDESDIYNYEAGGASALGGVVYNPVPTQSDGSLAVDDIARALRDSADPQCARAGLVCLENPHNRLGGLPLSLDYLRSLAAFCWRRDLPLHMDGARIFNAAIALSVPVADIAAHARSLQFCFSKSLAAPVGSMVLGEAAFVGEVRRLRKMIGGGMRQTGYLAAAANVALDEMVNQLTTDHANARTLAAGLTEIPEIYCDAARVQTNMVFFEFRDPAIDVDAFLAALARCGVRMGVLGHRRIRAVVHYGVSNEDVERAIARVRGVLEAMRTPAMAVPISIAVLQ